MSAMPHRLKREFGGHDVKTAREAGFSGLKNGALLRAADASFDVLITVDKKHTLSTESDWAKHLNHDFDHEKQQVRRP